MRKPFRRCVHAVLGEIISSDCQGTFRIENWSLYARILLSPRRCPVCCEILDLLAIVRLEGRGYISDYELAFPEMAWDMGYLTQLCFHPRLIKPRKAEQTLREKQSWTTWCSGLAMLTGRWRHTDPSSPSGIWQVRLFSPQLGRRQNGNLRVIEWKYQKYIMYWELRRQMKRKSRRRSEKVSKMGGSESKATIGVHD